MTGGGETIPKPLVEIGAEVRRGPKVEAVVVQLAVMVGNCILVELIFARPGIGLYISRAIDKADFNAIAGVTLAVGLLYVLTNIAVDVMQSIADPRVAL